MARLRFAGDTIPAVFRDLSDGGRPWWVRRFPHLFGAVVLWKLFLAWRFPFLGDEAYFLLWGRNPALGYYDHPPMLGWWLAPLARLGESPFLLRLPTVLVVAGLGIGIHHWLRARAGEEAAAAGSLLFLLSPFYLVDVFVLTDTPLLLFVFLAGVASHRGVETERPAAFLAAGAFLGLAFLSKYLAALLGVAFAVHAAVDRRPRILRGLLLTVLAASPFLLFHLWWNLENGWPTVLFNVVNRHVGEADRYTWRNVLICLGAHLWFLGPTGAWIVPRHAPQWWSRLRPPRPSLLVWSALLPLTLLSLSSAIGPFGAYWLMPFYPFLYLALPAVVGLSALRKILVGTAVFAALHVAVFTWAVARPLEAWKGAGFYDSLVMMRAPDEVAAAVQEIAGDRPLAALGYSPASLLAWGSGGSVAVFGPGSHYARQDDVWTDWHALGGGRLAMFLKREPEPGTLDPYFDSLRIDPIEVRGVTYFVALGSGFRYDAYREKVLEPACRRYYSVPEWLPGGEQCPAITPAEAGPQPPPEP